MVNELAMTKNMMLTMVPTLILQVPLGLQRWRGVKLSQWNSEKILFDIKPRTRPFCHAGCVQSSWPLRKGTKIRQDLRSSAAANLRQLPRHYSGRKRSLRVCRRPSCRRWRFVSIHLEHLSNTFFKKRCFRSLNVFDSLHENCSSFNKEFLFDSIWCFWTYFDVILR